MSDFPASALPDTAPAAAELLRAVFDVSLSALNLLRPLYAAEGGEIVDFAFDYLNPAAQRLTGLAGQPGGTLLGHFPNASANGLFDLYRRVFETGETGELELHYQANQGGTFLQVAARRQSGLLVASFLDAPAGPHTAVETALRESRAREQAARTEAEAERSRLLQVLERLPANVALLSGPEHRYSYANPEYRRLFPGRPVLGRTLREVIPELEGQGYYELFDRVFETGEPYYQPESEAWADYAGTGQPQRRYYRTTFEPLRNAEGTITEVLNFAVDVTAQVEARQQVERLSQEAEAARAEAERQRGELLRVFEQAPIAIAVYRGPQYVIELANPTVCRLWGRRQKDIIGKGLFEALPEVAGMGYEQLLDEVMATGVPYVAHAMPAQHDRNGRRETVYWDFVYVPMYEPDGRIYGAMVVATEVTTQVLAHQQMQQLNEELELRVTARSAEARAAQFEAEQQREQARHQQALLGQILRQTPAAIATLTGPEHRFSFFNDEYLALTAGRARLGQKAAELLPEVEEQGFIALLDQVYATGEPFVGTETTLLLQNAAGQPQLRHIDFIYQPLFDGQRRPQGILAFVLDVTDRVRARKQAETLQAAMMGVLRRQGEERENVFQLFEQAPAAICLLREPDHRIDYLNPAYQALFPGQELRGQTLAAAQPDNPTLVTLFDAIYRGGVGQFQAEVPMRVAPPDGPALTRYFDFTYQAYREQGRNVGVSLFGFDVTERVLTRRQRDAEQQLVVAVFEQSPTAIWVVEGPNYVFSIVNPLMEQILGHKREQLLGRPYFEAIPELATQGLPELLGQVWRSGETLAVNELPVRLAYHQPDERGYFSFVFQPLRGAQGQVERLACVATEVTAQVLARQQVQGLNEELAAINEEMQATNQELHGTNARLLRTNTDLDTFVYTASHDLKAPISNIEGLLEALRHDLPPAVLTNDGIARLLELMQGSVVRFQQTIGHLTAISQLQQPETAETVDLAALVRGVRLDLAPLIMAAEADLTVTINGCQAVRVAPKTLRSVVYNLLSNAVKYRSPGRPAQVQLRAHCAPQHLLIEVQDNGLGLSEEQQGRLFGMFRRLHTHVEGSGVGLFMVKRLVENAGGTIEVESTPEVGTTFRVTLPT
ncbi:PAS domain-containing sensor histidine kinase [Hymenobacter properus]|uniref:histidine kinase n=1 Tax=Hymenobacter properus TaxID=2791026 RepID=A0A931FMR4_9BACT|nr:PAS domain-containing protein [Hymenobacter properus]MBF9144270.1 PAS domain-containing protein [Hymenobacter properus]MBR7723088.1 PAS domain-containing protein [Microvirga sp. SRT04]